MRFTHWCCMPELCSYSCADTEVLKIHGKTSPRLPSDQARRSSCLSSHPDAELSIRHESFIVGFIVIHTGDRVTSGHYRTVLCVPKPEPPGPSWESWICDDSRPPKKCTSKDDAIIRKNSCLVGLVGLRGHRKTATPVGIGTDADPGTSFHCDLRRLQGGQQTAIAAASCVPSHKCVFLALDSVCLCIMTFAAQHACILEYPP